MTTGSSGIPKAASGTNGESRENVAGEKSFDVFLSYGRSDAEAVETIAARLEDEANLLPFLDVWHLIPGEPWQEELESALDHSQTCAVFIGPAGLGPWENEEMRSALDMRDKHSGFRVIPVLLPGATMPERGGLPRFLSRRTWVDFRGPQGLQDADHFAQLLAGIRGEPPGRRRGIGLTQIIECPYPGLQAFDENDRRFFFGREAVVQELIETLRQRRFLAVVGPSGSGKSSVLRAGLLPQLRAGALPASADWRYFVLTPGAHPLQELALSLTRGAPDGQTPARALDLIKSFNADERALHLALRLLPGPACEERCCFAVDQFEEVFTLCSARDERLRFINLLRYAATIASGQAIIVITMRADFVARAAEYVELGELLSGNQFIISPMDEVDLRRAIEEPAHGVGAQFEAGLVDTILRDAGREPGVLPLMEYALLQLWQKRSGDVRLTLHAYNEIDGLRGALARRADEIFNAFSPEQQRIARRVLLRLTQPGESTEDTRRRAAMSELETAPGEKAATDKVLLTLTNARLLVSDNDQVDVAHEALIRGWPRLHKWIEEDRGALRFHRRITEAAQEWELQRDEGALFRGASLAQAQEWREHHDQDLNALERDFLDASAELRQRQERTERERQQRELEQARALAEEQAARAEAERQRATEQERVARRLRWLPAGLSVATVLAALTGVFALIQRGRATQQTRIATAGRLVAEAKTSVNDHPDLALILAAEAAQTANTWEVRDALLTALQSAIPLKTFLHGHTNSVMSVAFSPDGKTLASASGDKTVRLWDIASRQPLGAPLTGHTNSVMSVAFSPDGKTLASASWDQTVRLWDIASRQPLGAPLTGHTDSVMSVAFSPDGKTVASASWDQTVRLWDIASRQPLGAPLTGHTDSVMSVAFSPDGKTLASASADQTIRLWDVASRQPLGAPLTGHTNYVTSVAFSPDGKTLASASVDNTVRLWDVASRQPLGAPLTGHTYSVMSVAFSPDGKTLASASGDKTVRLWDVASRQPLGAPLTGHTYSVMSVAFTPDGKTLASASVDQTIRLWDIASRQPLGAPLTGHTNSVMSVAFSPDGKTLASASVDQTVRLWDIASRQPLGAPLTGHTNSVMSVAFSPDGKTLASASWDKTVRLWDVASRPPLGAPLTGHTYSVMSVAFSPDGKTLASASGDNTVRLWDVASRQPLGAPLTGHTNSVMSVAFSPDGKTLASASGDKTVRLWDIASRQPLGAPLTGHTNYVMSVAFSPDGKTLASASGDKTVRLWDIASRQPLGAPLTGHTNYVMSVAFSPDGKTLASASVDQTIRLWDVASRQPLGAPLTGHTNYVMSVAFSPDGKTLASASSDRTVRLWNLDLNSWVTRACDIANRNLTCDEWRQYVGNEKYQRTCANLPAPICP